MKHLSVYLFVLLAVLLPAFPTTDCRAQEEAPILYAGLLGATGGGASEAGLLAPAAIGQAGHPDWKISLRLGDFSFKADGVDDLAGSQFFYGIGVTKNIRDNISFRGSFDYISGDYSESELNGGDLENYDWEMNTLSLKTTALIHPEAGSIGGSNSGYFNPYIGIGLEINLSTIDEDEDINGVPSLGSSESDTAFGIHFLTGIDYVFNDFSLGLEFSYNCAEAQFFGPGTRWDIGGLSMFLTAGWHF